MCGEQPGGFLFSLMVLGSPPRVRGTAYAANERYAVAGITPACAGNRQRAGSVLCSIEDHPRVCGEQP